MAIVQESKHTEIRRLKIIENAERQKQRSVSDNEKDFFELDEYQKEWVKTRMSGPAWTWERWDGIIEEWTPWNILGEPTNIWRYYKL